ncbi:hypothetical protein ACEUA6_20675, partial [Aeromonas veronii]
MSEQLSPDDKTRKPGLISGQQALAAILDHAAGNCYVLVGFYSDRSGAKLFGVYDDLPTAEDRQKLL